MIAWVLAGILVPLLGGVCALIVPKSWVKGFSQVVAFLAFLCSLLVLIELGQVSRSPLEVDLFSLAGVVAFGVIVDKMSALVGLAMTLVGFLIVVYSAGYLGPGNREHPEAGMKRRYAFFLLVFIGSMAGLVYSSTMIGLLVFFELTGVCSWGLIAYDESPDARNAALKAIVTTQVASLGLYAATAVFFVLSESLQLSKLAELADGAKLVIFIGILIAAWGKSAQLPFHFWLPDAMVAPTPVSAYLHAASLVNAGVYVFARTLIAAGHVPEVIGTVGAVMAVLTMLYGLLMYFPQRDLKRLLAYSTITQLACIFLALSVSIFGSRLAFEGAVAHIFNHAFAKGLFFLVAGALSYAAGTKMLPSLRGIGRKMPLVGVSFAVAMLGVIGVPPFNGFFSKFSILAGGFLAGRSHPFLLVLMVVALLEMVASFAWLFWVFGRSVLGEPSIEVASATRLSGQIRIPLVSLCLLTLVSGVFAAAWMA